jgi:hypothetical protein
LWVDLLDRAPTEDDTGVVRDALGKNDLPEVVRILVFSREAPAVEAIRPKSLDHVETWTRDLYARVLLRFPSPRELEAAEAEVKRSSEGWKHVVKELVLREGYQYY